MNIVVTAGGTNEKIDDVRFITNMSTGKLGSEIINSLTDKFFNEETLRDHTIFYIYAKGADFPVGASCIRYIEVTDTRSVEATVKKIITENKIDYFIHSMAISDYAVDKVFTMDDIINALSDRNPFDKSAIKDALVSMKGINNDTKISSENEEMFISMKKTPKIIDMIKKTDKNIFLISFKLLSDVSRDKLIEVAQKQLERTDSDIVIANDLKTIRNGSHKAIFVEKNNLTDIESKLGIADEITKRIGERNVR